MNDQIFSESPFSSELLVPEPEYDRDYIPECPSDFDDEADEKATQAFLDSLGVMPLSDWYGAHLGLAGLLR